MDPDANIDRQIELAEQIVNANELDAFDRAAGEELAELVIALHNWRLGGGFDPYA